MPEQKTELKTYQVDYLCDTCGQGIMVLNGNKDKKTELWPHKCDSCGEKKDFKKIYPQKDLE